MLEMQYTKYILTALLSENNFLYKIIKSNSFLSKLVRLIFDAEINDLDHSEKCQQSELAFCEILANLFYINDQLICYIV